MKDLTVSIIQHSLLWQEPDANRQLFARLIAEQAQASDLIVLPEVFTTGFCADSRVMAESTDGPTLHWMQEQAQQSGAVITGSVIVKEGEQYFNRLYWVRPEGSFEQYDKRHLFRMAGEHKRFSPGDKKLIVELKGWRCCPLICYDLRFPVWSRRNSPASEDYDLLIYVANWPSARAEHWRSLLKARAIENLCCVVGVNRIGSDGKGFDYAGDSVILDAEGCALVEPRAQAGCFTVTVDAEAQKLYRERFPAHLDGDQFSIIESL